MRLIYKSAIFHHRMLFLHYISRSLQLSHFSHIFFSTLTNAIIWNCHPQFFLWTDFLRELWGWRVLDATEEFQFIFKKLKCNLNMTFCYEFSRNKLRKLTNFIKSLFDWGSNLNLNLFFPSFTLSSIKVIAKGLISSMMMMMMPFLCKGEPPSINDDNGKR